MDAQRRGGAGASLVNLSPGWKLGREVNFRSFWLPGLLVAGLNFLAQLALRWELAPGEFGTLNALLGVIGLALVPALAAVQFLEREARADFIPVAEMLVLGWTLLSVPLLFFSLPLLGLSRLSLDFFALLNLVVALGAVASGVSAQAGKTGRRWAWFLVAAAALRAVAGAALGWFAPWSESGLAAVLLASLLLVMPLLVSRDFELTKYRAALFSLKRDFWVQIGAVVSVAVGLFLFTGVDRILAQTNFGRPEIGHMNFVDLKAFDDYQAAGLLGRALLWGTQPLLAIFFLQRATIQKTTVRSLDYFWIYLGVLVLGGLVLGTLGRPLAEFFSRESHDSTWRYLPAFVIAMMPIGLLQGLGVFALASRRLPECFVLGGCGVAYTLPLYFAGRQPQLMLAYMFGGALISLMIVLLVGVVRWGRRQP